MATPYTTYPVKSLKDYLEQQPKTFSFPSESQPVPPQQSPQPLKEVVIIKTDDVRNQFVADKLAIQKRLEEAQKRLIEIQKGTAELATQEAKAKEQETTVKKEVSPLEMTPEERAAFGIQAREKSAEETKLETDIKTLNDQTNQVIADYDTLLVNADTAQQATIQDIKNLMAKRKKQQEDINYRNYQDLQQFGFRFGAMQYAPTIAGGILTAQEQAGLDRLTELDQQEQTLINQAKAAGDANKAQLLRNKMEAIEKVREEKTNTLAGMQKTANEEYKKQKEQFVAATRQTAIASLISQGITDPAKVLEYLNYDEQGNLVGDVSMDEVGEVFNVMLKSVASPLEEKVADGIDEQGRPYISLHNKRTGEVRTVFLDVVEKQKEEDIYLSPAEAEKLNVPYGTTKKEAMEKGIIPKTPKAEETLLGGLTKDQRTYLNAIQSDAIKDPDIKIFSSIRGSYEQGKAAYERAKSGAGPGIGDIVLMRTVAKITDPTSSVREEEFATFEGAQSTLAKFGVAITKKWWQGDRLSDLGREQMFGMLKDIYEQRKAAYDFAYNFYEKQATDVGIPPKMVLPYYTAVEKEQLKTLKDQVDAKGYNYDQMKADGFSDDEIKKTIGL